MSLTSSLRARLVAAALLPLVLAAPRLAHAIGAPAAGAAIPATLKLPSGPGSVRGLPSDASVRLFSGDVAYQVPFEVPVAVAGFAPQLALRYGGDLGNGSVGVGWALSSLSIRRSLRQGVPGYTDADALELSGGLDGNLVATGEGEYRVQGAGLSVRVRKSGEGFEVVTADGLRYHLGTSASSRLQNGTRVAEWFVDDVTDVTGQTILYTYVQDGGRPYLGQVSWGPSGAFSVVVEHAARPDSVLAYRTGFAVTTALRVARVRVFAFGEELRRYELGYDDTLPLSRLAQVRMLGRGGVDALPALTFSYASTETPRVTAIPGVAGWVLNARGTTLLDVDADALPDLVRFEAGNHQVRRNLGGSFDVARSLSGAATGVGLDTTRLVDVDGDSRAELIRVVDDTWRVYRLVGDAWQAPTTLPGSAFVPSGGAKTSLLDVNGDQRTDALVYAGGSNKLYLATATGFAPARIVNPISVLSPGVVPGSANLRFHDVNGDGLDDAVWLSDTWLQVFLGRGDGSFDDQPRRYYPWVGSTVLSNIELVDLNRDGLLDLVHFGSAKVSWHRGYANGTFSATPLEVARPEGANADVVQTVADVNGNGSRDIVWSSPRGMSILDLAGSATAGMLVGIDNGMGKVQSLEYTSSALLAAQDRAAGQPWAYPLPIVVPVPTRGTLSTDPEAPTRVVERRVRDGFWDAGERRFGGFLTGTERQIGATSADTLVTTTTCLQGLGDDRVLRGVPLRVTVASGDGQVLSVAENTWEARSVLGLGTSPLLRKAAQTSTRTSSYEHVATPIVTLTTHAFDAEGRDIEDSDSGRLDLAGDERVVRRSYASDETTGVRDRVVEEKLYAGDGTTLLHCSRTLFGDDAQILPFGQVGKGWPRQIDERLEFTGESRWVTTRQLAYQPNGQVASETTGGVTRRLGYDGNGLHPVSESIDAQPGVTLTWSMVWDDVLGQPLEMTTPAGDRTRASYDALGRVIGLGLAGKPAHTVYAYDLSGPRPRVITHTFDGRLEDLTAFSSWSPGSGWRESVSYFDGAGAPLFDATRLDAATWSVAGLRTYDLRGRVDSVAASFFASDIEDLAVAPANVPRQRLRYDAFARPVEQTLATGGTLTFGYAAFTTTRTETGLAPVVQRFDGLGRTVHSERLLGSTLEQIDAVYDAASRITSLSLGGGTIDHRFEYDSLDRLRHGEDPDLGVRTYGYDDAGHLLSQQNAAGQTLAFSYDGAGRVLGATDSAGKHFTYHYDAPRVAASQRTLSRLAWVEEPTGTVDFSYDELGRQSWMRRTVDGRSGEKTVRYSPSGLLLSTSNDDGFVATTRYDDAGRPVGVNNLWQATSLDAAGRVLEERFGNGVRETYQRDALGAMKTAKVVGASGAVFYDVTLGRDTMGRLRTVTDSDGVGLNHSASYDFDEAARLVHAEEGSGAHKFVFGYGYDALQNMVTRSDSGPVPVNVLTGTYRYGENGAGPRQLSSVLGETGAVSSFAYDAAGRMTVDGDRRFAYDGFDQLERVSKNGALLVDHAYGYDGQRVRTRTTGAPDQIWFAEDLVDRGGARQHYVRVGGRLVARVDGAGATAAHAGSTGFAWLDVQLVGGVLVVFLLGGLAALVVRLEPRRRLRGAVAGLTLASFAVGCVAPNPALVAERSALTVSQVLYFHQGPAAGSVLMTRGDGSVADERRFEPFGAPIEAARPGQPSASVDFAIDPTNSLDKETDATTGLSYHGARWMDPRTARWTTGDPPTKAPDVAFMDRPWRMHPYQYVDQNPVEFFDPDGRQPVRCEADDGRATPAPPVEAPAPVRAAAARPAPTVTAPAPRGWHAPMALPEEGPLVSQAEFVGPVDDRPQMSQGPGWTPPATPHPTPSAVDGLTNLGWDVAGFSKKGGKANAAVDVLQLGKAVVTGDVQGMKQSAINVTLDVASTDNPLLAVEQTVWDTVVASKRIGGATPEEAPTFSEAIQEGMPTWRQVFMPWEDDWAPEGPRQ